MTMTNRIQSIRVIDGRLDPAEAEVWISIDPECLTTTTQARGRLMGPRCPYSTTVEVAYPLREQSREYESTGRPGLIMRVIIPEASLWDPQSPFLYEGPVELWQGKERCDQAWISHGLRMLTLGPQGLRCNGKPLPLCGAALGGLSEAEARSLRQARYNSLLAPASADAALWDLADRFGFLVLARTTAKAELKAEFQRAQAFRKHACCLGWVVTPEAVDEDLALLVAQCLPDQYRCQLLGMELRQPPSRPLPDKVSFIVCEEELLPALAALDVPKVLLRKGIPNGSDTPAAAALRPGILGWITE
jgi:hypothetical protein